MGSLVKSGSLRPSGNTSLNYALPVLPEARQREPWQSVLQKRVAVTDSTGDAFVKALLDSMPSTHARMALMSCLARFAGRTIYLPAPSKAARRVNVAANMIANGMSDADTANTIHDRFNVSLRTAQRDVKAARQMST